MSFSEPCALAVDFGGTSIKMGVTAGDRILATADRIPTTMFESPQAIIDAMVATALGLREQFPTACVMGMGMPGWCDYYKGVLYQLTNVKVWDHEIPVKEMMERAVGLPVVLDNDANCMAYAEWKLGAGRGMSSLVCLTMGTGIGGRHRAARPHPAGQADFRSGVRADEYSLPGEDGALRQPRRH